MGKSLLVRVHLKSAVGEEEGAVASEVAIGNHHDEERTDELHARCGFEDLKARAQYVSR